MRNADLLRRGLRHPDVFVASLRHHTTRIVTRPIRTALTVAFVYAFVIALVAFTQHPEETRVFLENDPSVSGVVPLLPPTTVMAVIAIAAVVGVPVGMVANGVRRDLRSSTRRRQLRNR
ncbi:hypothetical protein [Natronobiforma cellulositropha]|uniref:hypothetical protein n=1 Tax=Natronobiforma cellulositropha TaxID=1679076 RepID=UPI0021D603B3|nr:hypothetical protein [Natronobiforma cellulositropha]